eukprot:scaffold40578_cov72-Cyclotella_meneghiniana.AAC.5
MMNSLSAPKTLIRQHSKLNTILTVAVAMKLSSSPLPSVDTGSYFCLTELILITSVLASQCVESGKVKCVLCFVVVQEERSSGESKEPTSPKAERYKVRHSSRDLLATEGFQISKKSNHQTMFALSTAIRSRTTHSALLRACFSTTTPLSQYDVVVVGGGPGGYVAAIKAGQLGLKTACVEMRGSLGGTCLNVGCIPSKALLQSSHHYHDAKHHFADHGISVGEVTMDVSKMLDSKAKTVQGLTGGIEHLFKKHKVDYFKGKGSLSGPTGVEVQLNDGGVENLETKNVIIATGSEVTPLPPVPVDNAGGKIVDSTGALDISSIPTKMAVIGGGVIGLEMGSVWSRLGTDVTVIEFMDRLCPAMDQELTKKFQTTLKKQGFKFQLKTKVMSSQVVGDGVEITTEPSAGGDSTTEKYDVAAVGKTEEELKEAGVQYNKGTFPFQANSRARANGTGNTDGFVKILTDKATDKMLGIHIMGPNAGEMIAEGVLGMEYGASSEDIARTCHAHPTLSEAFKEACMDAYDKPIHF